VVLCLLVKIVKRLLLERYILQTSKTPIKTARSRILALCRVALALPFLLMCVSTNSFGLDPNKPINQFALAFWNKQNGLPTNLVSSVVQTRDGYIWLGTGEGLVRFNGAQFTVFNRKNTPGISDDVILNMIEARDGALWIATGAGLTRYKDGRFSNYTTGDGLPSNTISSLYEDNSGNIWAGTFGSGVACLSNGKFTNYSKEQGLLNGMTLFIQGDAEGGIWFGTYDGLFEYKGGKFLHYRDPGLGEDIITAMRVTNDGTIFLGKGSKLYSFNGGIFTEIKPPGMGDFKYFGAIYQDREGGIWFSDTNKLTRYYKGVYQYYDLKDTPFEGNGFAVLEDREENIWLTSANGVGCLIDRKFVTLTKKNGLPLERPVLIITSRDGSMWAAHDGKVTHYRNGVINPTTGLPLEQTDLAMREAIMCLYEARDGSLWIATHSGVRRYRAGKMTSFTIADGLPSNLTWSITETPDGVIWVATNNGLGRFDGARFSTIASIDNVSIEYPGHLIKSKDGGFWMATLKGLCHYKDGHLSLYGSTKDQDFGAIYEDDDQVVWSTTDRGFVRLKNGRFTEFSSKDGLSEENLYSILEANGDLWFTGKSGILRLNKQNLNDYAEGRTKIIHNILYGAADGLADMTNYNGSPFSTKTADGRLWFVTERGLVVTNPGAMKTNNLVPPVVIEQVTVDKKSLDQTGPITLLPGTKEIEFRFAALTFVAPEASSFKYKLDGFDKDWVNADTERSARYMNLPPGTYRFRVIACNSDGVWNANGAVLDFYLKPHFYQTYWFYSLCALAAILMAAFAYNLRISQLKTRERELSKRVEAALAEVKVLSGLLPICACCKKIREDNGYWTQIESYIHHHSEADFSHSICPECVKDLYPEAAAAIAASKKVS